MIDRPQVRIRSDATVQSQRLEVLQQGVVVEMLSRKSEWFNVRLADGREGWVHSNLVQERLVVTGAGVRYRESGSSSSRGLGVTSFNDVVGKIRQQGNWCEVELETGATGWMSHNYLRPLEVSLGRATVAPAAPPEDPEEEAAVIAPSTGELEEPATVPQVEMVPNHYVHGLRQESAGDYASALRSFEKVLESDPDKLNARRRAALAHKQLGNLDAALDHLYQALRQTGGRRHLYLDVGEIYRLKDIPDSTSKYKALYRGEDPADAATSASEAEALEVAEQTDPLWIIYAAGVGGAAVLGLLVLIFVRQHRGRQDPDRLEKGRDKGERHGRGKFGRDLQESSSRRQAGSINAVEEDDLDAQIAEKWRELRESSLLLEGSGEGAPGQGGEDTHLEQIVGHLETLRGGLDMQESRANIYADIVRLQRMKIEAMSEELRALRATKGRSL